MPPRSEPKASASPPQTVPLAHQQILLDIFNTTFSSILSSDTFDATLQEIKQALFNRDFAQAFSKEEYLDVYAARWSPGRALGYANIFDGLRDSIDATATDGTLRMVSLGGCGAEQVAFASYVARSKKASKGELVLVDSAPWSSASQKIHEAITAPLPLSKYASAAKKAANTALLSPSDFQTTFKQANVLDLTRQQWADILGPNPVVVTIMFTLNELYTAGGIGKTTKFIINLGGALPKNSVLVMVDSPGDYSETTVGKESRKYPISWLLQHSLEQMETQEKIVLHSITGSGSVWFRLNETLDYRIPLENMRYQMQAFRVGEEARE
ncbi:hypothetical protein VHEMI08221 [[Torrubiella] hemipterigena]|uniref:Histidine-specific methyltransferase SAM-dependent domain-containing protein n=1 Tax=[Torrubiella] hemipterigena TaxID=1531966 RepID=A0A0A1TPB5_9HYPO|nr:hypothetical protein VHEMI08221 [[Torrubiella] hemipterigena]